MIHKNNGWNLTATLTLGLKDTAAKPEGHWLAGIQLHETSLSLSLSLQLSLKGPSITSLVSLTDTKPDPLPPTPTPTPTPTRNLTPYLWLTLALNSHPFFGSNQDSGGCWNTSGLKAPRLLPWTFSCRFPSVFDGH